MLFSSSVFLFLFLPVVLLVYYLPLRKWRLGQNIFLTLASLFFYAWGEPWFVLVMMGSIVANYLFGLWVAAWKNHGRSLRLPVTMAVICNLSILFIFKYLTFVLTNLNLLGFQLTVPIINLPIGISFFTFQAMSYVLDVARGRGQAQKSLLNVGLYISFFPQLIAGPIVKYETVAEEIHHRRETWDDFTAGVQPLPDGPGQKGHPLQPAGRGGRRRLQPRPAPVGGLRLAGRRVLHPPALLRLRRLLRHGHRPGPDVRLPLPGELRLPLHLHLGHRVLAPVAHLPHLLVP